MTEMIRKLGRLIRWLGLKWITIETPAQARTLSRISLLLSSNQACRGISSDFHV